MTSGLVGARNTIFPSGIVHDNGSDQRLAQAFGQTHHRAGVKGLLNYVELVVSDGVIGGGGEVSASETSFLVGGLGASPRRENF